MLILDSGKVMSMRMMLGRGADKGLVNLDLQVTLEDPRRCLEEEWRFHLAFVCVSSGRGQVCRDRFVLTIFN